MVPEQEWMRIHEAFHIFIKGGGGGESGYNQLGPRWQKIPLPVDLELHCTLIVILAYAE